ncbi:hypothetical protein [Sulfurospirillum sp. 1612]|uniref:hypothetical protein n=1 Tax=Sulfurospirillum sp. 1612 TaxID=3094835 RepID=UPI002F92DB65
MKFLSMIVGAGLLVAAIVLSFVVSSNGETIIANQKKLTTEYVSKSDTALQNGDISSALKYAKLAISANPKGTAGFDAYNKVMEAKYKPATQETAAPVAPAPDMSEDDSADMGC